MYTARVYSVRSIVGAHVSAEYVMFTNSSGVAGNVCHFFGNAKLQFHGSDLLSISVNFSDNIMSEKSQIDTGSESELLVSDW